MLEGCRLLQAFRDRRGVKFWIITEADRTTAKEYRGINIVILGMAEYTSRYWVTYRQAQPLGGQVRNGERSTPVIYWK